MSKLHKNITEARGTFHFQMYFLLKAPILLMTNFTFVFDVFISLLIFDKCFCAFAQANSWLRMRSSTRELTENWYGDDQNHNYDYDYY